jgi:hypothetical protein
VLHFNQETSAYAPPAAGTIQICGVLPLAARSTSTTLKITHLPSGETSGAPTRLSFIMSSKVKRAVALTEGGKGQRHEEN